MGTMSKAIAGGAGAAAAKIAVQILKHYFPDVDSDSLEYLIYTIITGLVVYHAPANTPAST